MVALFSADNNNSPSFKFKEKVRDQTRNYGTQGVQMMVSLKYVSNFWRFLEIPLINCEINLFLDWLTNCFIMAGVIDSQLPIFATADIKLYIPVVTLSNNDNAKLLQPLRTGFKRTINWN